MLLSELLNLRLDDPVVILHADTRAHYHRSLRQFNRHLEREATVDDLTAEALMRWANQTVADGLTPVTANSRIKQLRALWDWAARRRYVEDFPPKGMSLSEPVTMPDAWTPSELTAIFEACGKQTGWIGPHKASVWWLGLHWWLYNTGERFGATCLLEPSMVDLESGIANVPATIRKGCVRPMAYKLSTRGLEAVAAVMERSEEQVFTQPWSTPQGVYKRYRNLLDDAGVQYKPRKSGPQKMRRTVATYVRHLGGEPAYYLGHASRTVTEESYIDRGLLLAHDGGVWPRDDFDPLSRKPWYARVWRAG